MPNVVFDASSLVGALLKEESVPERALLLARAHAVICRVEQRPLPASTSSSA
jgi:hypothetical protein